VGEADPDPPWADKNIFTAQHAEIAEIHPGKEKASNALKSAKEKKFGSFGSNLQIRFYH
jgi:hypothetical protein